MMKFISVLAVFCCFFLFPSCTVRNQSDEQASEPTSCDTREDGQIRAMWLSCYELSAMLSAGTHNYFSDKISEVFELCKAQNINTLFIHVRPFYDALYPSKLFEWSEFAKSSSGQFPDFDPLQIAVDIAADYGVSVHAWINPYRVSYEPSAEISQAIGSFAFFCDEGVFLDPSSVEAQSRVLEGVREILENYDVTGIHIDDYFYPQTNENFDETIYEAYIESGGRLSKSNWRRENVNSLVSALYSLVHSLKSEAVFSISPAGDIRKNKNAYYADVELWLEQNGYADWIVPQIYFGFKHESMPFEKTAKKWFELARNSDVRIICGLASYKQGEFDAAAGSGASEWVDNADVIDLQIEYTENMGFDGYAIFSYASINKK